MSDRRATHTALPAAPGPLIEERRKTHGDWAATAKWARLFKEVFREARDDRERRGAKPLAPTQTEAIEMALGKIARIVSGDPDYADHWDDIAGYARLGRDGMPEP